MPTDSGKTEHRNAVPSRPSFELTEGQERRLRLFLGHLAAEGMELGHWLADHPHTGTGGAEEWVSELESQLQELVELARATAGNLGVSLDVRGIDPARRMQAWASVWWANVLDCRPQALRGYGPVDPELEATLGPAIEALTTRLMSIRRLAGEQFAAD